MTLDEAIKHCREVTNSQNQSAKLIEKNIYIPKSVDKYDMVYDCQQCAEEHEQLAEWLEELKDLRKCVKSKAFVDGYNKGRTDGIKEIYNKLDEGMCFICEYANEDCFKYCSKNGYEVETFKKWLERQLKEQKND